MKTIRRLNRVFREVNQLIIKRDEFFNPTPVNISNIRIMAVGKY
jgi:hypothetical protein